MSSNTQSELDEILDTLAEKSADSDSRLGYVDAYVFAQEAKQAILDWHNKQIEEVLDRLKSKSFAIKQDIEVSQYPARSIYEPEIVSAHHKVIPVSAIEAERNKLKEE